ncbi:MAG: hypothetical protein E7030_08635 [Akkermansiaceae bacterium]|nr:hypothetical protein [Akkermansiaceae bacterium]
MNRLSLTAIALCSTMVLASCSVFSQKKTEDTPAPKAEAKQTATATPVTPTAEQQAAAAALQNVSGSVVATEDTLSLPTEPVTQSAPTTYQPTTGIPGRSGLRMGHFAPPEEAASSSENAPPAPNAAELRGLRSPSLPKNLPLDVNGQSKKN